MGPFLGMDDAATSQTAVGGDGVRVVQGYRQCFLPQDRVVFLSQDSGVEKAKEQRLHEFGCWHE